MSLMILPAARVARWLIPAMTALGLLHAVAVSAEATGDYSQDLGAVYGGYQRMLAMKDACDAAAPAARRANEQSFAAWQAQHWTLIQDLQRRVTAMIRLASQDEKEYVRNLGKYEGVILQERQAYGELLLGRGADELREQCQRMPERLKGPGADLEQVYESELEVIRRRK